MVRVIKNGIKLMEVQMMIMQLQSNKPRMRVIYWRAILIAMMEMLMMEIMAVGMHGL